MGIPKHDGSGRGLRRTEDDEENNEED